MDEFKIIGIAIRTTNQNGQSQNDIGSLWGKFMGQHIMEQIPDKETDDIYCVYTDYDSDFNGPYTTILGCRVNSFDNVPEGFISKAIPPAKYQVYKSKGKLPECVVTTWTNVWESRIDRSYNADFDIYGPKAQNPEHAEVDTYVSIR